VTTKATGVASPPLVPGVSAEEWRVLITARPNLLLVGDEAVTSEFLGALLPALQEPLWVTTAARLSLPTSSPGTLIVQDATSLAAADQMRLFQWLCDHQPGTQLVTTAAKPLMPFVLRGTFLETLYYRLNEMYVEF
jgi:sigma-54-interacting transcriptional regulator